MNNMFDKILPYEARAEFCQIFCSILGDGVSRRNAFEIYWPLMPSSFHCGWPKTKWPSDQNCLLVFYLKRENVSNKKPKRSVITSFGHFEKMKIEKNIWQQSITATFVLKAFENQRGFCKQIHQFMFLLEKSQEKT